MADRWRFALAIGRELTHQGLFWVQQQLAGPASVAECPAPQGHSLADVCPDAPHCVCPACPSQSCTCPSCPSLECPSLDHLFLVAIGVVGGIVLTTGALAFTAGLYYGRQKQSGNPAGPPALGRRRGGGVLG